MIVSFDRDAFQFYENCLECNNAECPQCMDKYKVFDAQSMIEVCNNLEKHEQAQKWISEHPEEREEFLKNIVWV